MISIKTYAREILTLEFKCSSLYNNPYTDVSLSVEFESSNGAKMTVPGFWHHGNTWKVRFVPPDEGEWLWISSASNVTDCGLHGLTGKFEALPSKSNTAIHKHGFLTVSKNGRGFIYEDGTPFFWLGDTVWAAPMKSAYNEWSEYLSYRHSQGFNVLQVNSLYQHDADCSQQGLPFNKTSNGWDLTRPCPEYFDYLDQMMYKANDFGMIIALVVLWCNFVPGTNPEWKDMIRPARFTPELAKIYGRYLAARYAAFGTVWVISGDTDYQDNNVISVYDSAARAIRNSIPYPILMTAHLSGRFFTPPILNGKEWLDFHMFQSGHHRVTLERSIDYSLKDRAYTIIRPVLNSEPCYEDICFFSQPERVNRSLARKVAWYSILSGANAGITYGAHGLWQWHHESDVFREAHKWGMPAPWNEALRFQGAKDYAALKGFLSTLRWWELEPNGTLLTADENSSMIAAADKHLDSIVAYLDCTTDVCYIGNDTNITQHDAIWFNPTNYTAITATALKVEDGTIIYKKAPWESDAVLYIKIKQGKSEP